MTLEIEEVYKGDSENIGSTCYGGNYGSLNPKWVWTGVKHETEYGWVFYTFIPVR